MTLIDTGPLIALLDRDDQHHRACTKAARELPAAPLLSTWPCFTEAMYLLGEVGGHRYQAALWNLRAVGRLVLYDLSASETDQVAELMEKYRDAPMDLADASLIAVADSLSLRRIFTLDRHFKIYRLPDGSVLEMIPG
ncbi:MAG TPA: PIN domain-containing protein [Longimicrobiaceae bacterium]|nr:PIN domain-containing protein [Longimicrobiaceae bacterium]